MTVNMIIAFILVNFFYNLQVNAHGKLVDPVSRSSAWRKLSGAPKNYNDNQLFCGGMGTLYQQNKGNCGPCGDNWSQRQPRDNENGGKYGLGVIVRRYCPGKRINITVDLSANHLGYFEFSLCPLNSTRDIETEECFAAHPIYLADGNLRYKVKKGMNGNIIIQANLPKDFVCPHCVFRWHYYGGNNWGMCQDGTGRLGCGIQEVFRGCADVSILRIAPKSANHPSRL
ncbi:uncharacterized protein LOC106639749 [Copidosoma floridanum]|uniref:uncharacterized protein LOC106639749 n=1 Tax=Copidosoma floridanum TaxID=29053 RepID=UPI0006C9A848|nr:uncharacterized protein LOC106639749 [Copidosoma floridanum]